MSFRSRGLHEHRMKLKFNSFGKVMEEWPGVLYLPCILVFFVFLVDGEIRETIYGWIGSFFLGVRLTWLLCFFGVWFVLGG